MNVPLNTTKVNTISINRLLVSGIHNLNHIPKTISQIKFQARIDYISKGKLIKKIKKNEEILIDGCHSETSAKNLADYLKSIKKPIYGICAGMQLFATKGHEEETTLGLNWIPGEVNKLDLGSSKLKIPHMGWNELKLKNRSKVFQDVNSEDHAYFIHSYEFIPEDQKVVSLTSNYGKELMAAVSLENIFGSQFHPEKSQSTGIKILTNFLNL